MRWGALEKWAIGRSLSQNVSVMFSRIPSPSLGTFENLWAKKFWARGERNRRFVGVHFQSQKP